MRIPYLELLAATLAAIGSFVDVHVWSPAYTYFLLVLLVITEALITTWLHRRPLRPLRVAGRVLAYTAVLAFAHGFGKHEPSLAWLPHLVLAPCVVFHLRKLIGAFGALDLVDAEAADLLNIRLTRKQEEAKEKEPA